MKCFLCKNEIEPKGNYFKFIELDNEKEKHTDYAHRICWDKFKQTFNKADSSLSTANKLLKGMETYLNNNGIIPKEDEVIII